MAGYLNRKKDKPEAVDSEERKRNPKSKFRPYKSLNEFGEARASGGAMADKFNLDKLDGNYNG